MKVLIKNMFIDFSTVTHIEDSDDEIIIHPFMSNPISISQDKAEMTLDFLKKLGISPVPYDGSQTIYLDKLEKKEFSLKEDYTEDRYWFNFNEETTQKITGKIKDLEEFHKNKFNSLKEKIIKTWKETESCIKDIKKM